MDEMNVFEKIINWITNTNTILTIITVVIAIALWIVIRKIRKKYKHDSRLKKQQATTISVTLGIINALLVIAAVFIVLQLNGVNVSSMVAGLGLFGVILGLILQDIFKDIIMGVHIIFDRFFSVGECVEYEGREGVILHFTIMYTKIGDLEDHSVYTVCNRNITEIRRLGNRMDIDLPLSYQENIQTVHTVLQHTCKIIQELADVTKCEYKGTHSFETSAILYKIRIYCSPKNRPDTRRAALMAIQNELFKAGIQIPYNQIDVHIDSLESNQVVKK